MGFLDIFKRQKKATGKRDYLAAFLLRQCHVKTDGCWSE